MEFFNVSIQAKANVYFDGCVISHTITLVNGDQKTVGVILPGSYHFGTKRAERMEILEGKSEVLLDGEEHGAVFTAGQAFQVPSNSGFTITVTGEPCHYVCSFLKR